MNLIILGPQGSGKGTQAKKISKKFNLLHVEAGYLLREAAKHDKSIDEIVNIKGKLVRPEIIFNLIIDFIRKNEDKYSGFLLDGYPRSQKQYDLFKDWLEKNKIKIDYAIFLDISEKESIKRLSARRICEKCGEVYNLITNPPMGKECKCGGKLIHRKDDQEGAIKTRLKVYKKSTEPLLNELKKEGILLSINGERSIDEIFEEISKKLKTLS